MIKGIIAFIVVTLLAHCSISIWRTSTGLERWHGAKYMLYSIGLGIIAMLILASIVAVF